MVEAGKYQVAGQLVFNKFEIRNELIEMLSTYSEVKKAAKLIKMFKLKVSDFPKVKVLLVMFCMRYYLGNYLFNKPDETHYMQLC